VSVPANVEVMISMEADNWAFGPVKGVSNGTL
jgi:hypothetical protein